MTEASDQEGHGPDIPSGAEVGIADTLGRIQVKEMGKTRFHTWHLVSKEHMKEKPVMKMAGVRESSAKTITGIWQERKTELRGADQQKGGMNNKEHGYNHSN